MMALLCSADPQGTKPEMRRYREKWRGWEGVAG